MELLAYSGLKWFLKGFKGFNTVKSEKLHNYRLAFESKEETDELKKQVQNIESIKSVEVRYSN